MSDELAVGTKVEIRSGSWSELEGVITFRQEDAAFVRLDGERFDLKFAVSMLMPLGAVGHGAGARLI